MKGATEKDEGIFLKLGTTYICVEDMAESVEFYRRVLEQNPAHANDDRWVTFSCGNSLSLYNKKYDEALLQAGQTDRFDSGYLEQYRKEKEPGKNNIVVFNFDSDDLAAEHSRLTALYPDQVSEIRYLNVHAPYYFFNITDPDGNILEITGPYVPGN